MPSEGNRRILVTGATGFIGRALVRALVARGETVIAASRKPKPQATAPSAVEWRQFDLLQAGSMVAAMQGVDVAYYLVHSMGSGQVDYVDAERRAAEAFVDAAARAGIKRIVYLGGPAPSGRPSEHLRSRLQVGEILRAGIVPTLELRASMVIGNGSTSWQIVRDLGMRLPVMILPKWLKSRTRPVAIDDVVTALLAASTMALDASTWFDIPGPEVMTGREILERIGALRGRQIMAIEIPLLTPQLSALWLKLVTRADFAVARELVLGLSEDLLPRDARFWQLIGHSELLPFDEAARRALMSEP
jgi:uncharacterized protein YbjT (DUF2867 family)